MLDILTLASAVLLAILVLCNASIVARTAVGAVYDSLQPSLLAGFVAAGSALYGVNALLTGLL